MEYVYAVTSAGRLLGLFDSFRHAQDSLLLTYSARPERLTLCHASDLLAEYVDEDSKEFVRIERQWVHTGLQHL